MTSVEIVDHIRIVTTVVNASLNDVGRIRDVLNAMGYRDFTVEVTTP
jgi:MinD superfamily P-loop ATPase